MKKQAVFLILMMIHAMASASGNVLEEYFYRSGKIQVVIAVAAVVLIGIFFYLFRLERKISRLEKQINSEEKRS